jgi:hypothetical protein
MTTFHGESDHFYEIGFRCCAEVRSKGATPASSAAPTSVTPPEAPTQSDNPY